MISVAAPIRDVSGRSVAAISVAGPAERLEPHELRLAQATVESAALISRRLGYRGLDRRRLTCAFRSGRSTPCPTIECVAVGDGRAVVVRVGDELRAFENRCLHQDSLLAGGDRPQRCAVVPAPLLALSGRRRLS